MPLRMDVAGELKAQSTQAFYNQLVETGNSSHLSLIPGGVNGSCNDILENAIPDTSQKLKRFFEFFDDSLILSSGPFDDASDQLITQLNW